MTLQTHIFRRGAVYYWRKRMPDLPKIEDKKVRFKENCAKWMTFSLKTRCAASARSLGALLSCECSVIFNREANRMLTVDQSKQLLVNIVREHSAKLNMINRMQLDEGSTTLSKIRREERIGAISFDQIASFGPEAKMTKSLFNRLLEKGLPREDIRDISAQINTYVKCQVYKLALDKVTKHLTALGIEVTASNLVEANLIRLRAIAAALHATETRLRDEHPEINALAERAIRASPSYGVAGVTKPKYETEPVSSKVHPSPQSTQDNTETQKIQTDTEKNNLKADGVSTNSLPDGLTAPDKVSDLAVFSARGALANQTINSKTAAQRIQTGKLFEKLCSDDVCAAFTQKNIASFRVFLKTLPKSYGKSPKDINLTAGQLMQRSKALPREDVGLAASTVGRHFSALEAIYNTAKQHGLAVAPLDFNGLRSNENRRRTRARDQRHTPTRSEIAAILNHPVFTGCAGITGKLRFKAGYQIVHDPLYWCMLIFIYTGARREEVAALLIDDIVQLDVSHKPRWCIKIMPHPHRVLKSAASERTIPIHAELVRLGFLDFVAKMRATKNVYLFPQLEPPPSKHEFGKNLWGDALYDKFVKLLTSGGSELATSKVVIHGLRQSMQDMLEAAKLGT